MRALLQDDVNFTDNEVLDEWRIPFGDWYDQAVSWVDNQLKPILDFIDGLFGLLIDFVNDTVLLGVRCCADEVSGLPPSPPPS